MSKRFTDSTKWRNEWFRTLPDRAKIAWMYLCDECNKAGIIKMDYGLASFQLGFKVTSHVLSNWFGHRIHFIGDDKILVVQYFEFQYGTSKDTWSAKVEARRELEQLGFQVIDNKVIVGDFSHKDPTMVPQSGDGVPTSLIRVRGRVRVNKGGVGEKNVLPDIAEIWNTEVPSLPKVRDWTNTRSKARAKFLETKMLDDWREICRKVEASDFLCGRSTDWKASFDWVLKPANLTKIIEGNFDNRDKKEPPKDEWAAKAQKVLSALKLPAGEERVNFLGDELMKRVRAIGGMIVVGNMPSNDFTVKKLATMLKSAELESA